jgi:hypothetical protein
MNKVYTLMLQRHILKKAVASLGRYRGNENLIAELKAKIDSKENEVVEILDGKKA